MYSHSWNGYHQRAISIGLSLYALPYQHVLEKTHNFVQSVVCSSVIMDTVLSPREENGNKSDGTAVFTVIFSLNRQQASKPGM